MSDRFAEIKKIYIATFAQKQMDLNAAWDDKDVTLLQSLLHKLAGSSGSYGFDDISLLCHKIMGLLESNVSDNKEQINDCLQEVFVLLRMA
ncbi:MAG: Hpt domain-containing protein [Alcanivoracaceae bacterium]|nr:Hpt domain-containing protein [Alcanivoracaceae bacterium]